MNAASYTRERKTLNEAKKLINYKEMEEQREVAPEVEKNKEPQDTLDKIWDVQEVREQHYDQGAKQWRKWTTKNRKKYIRLTGGLEAIGESAKVVRT